MRSSPLALAIYIHQVVYSRVGINFMWNMINITALLHDCLLKFLSKSIDQSRLRITVQKN